MYKFDILVVILYIIILLSEDRSRASVKQNDKYSFYIYVIHFIIHHVDACPRESKLT